MTYKPSIVIGNRDFLKKVKTIFQVVEISQLNVLSGWKKNKLGQKTQGKIRE